MSLAIRRTASRPSVLLVWAGAIASIATAGWLLAATPLRAQQPTFRSAVDLVAVDVQVIDGTGHPIPQLHPEHFQVTIGGSRRRVVSADYIQTTAPDGPPVTAGPSARNMWPESPTGGDGVGRVYVLAYDLGSLTLQDSRAVVNSSRSFIDRLQPADRVGLYTFPVGPRMEATLDHAAVRARIATVVGSQPTVLGEYSLTPSEVVDINYENARDSSLARRLGSGQVDADDAFTALRRVQVRECDGLTPLPVCTESILQAALNQGLYLEGRASESMNGLSTLVRFLSVFPGRKTLVMFSAGITASDRPGGRPDMYDAAKTLGKDAAATNTTIYAVQLNTAEMIANSAQTRKTGRVPPNHARDIVVQRRLMDEFSGASGGALMPVVTGSGEYALTRVLRETSSHYLLGVEPQDSDRDGKLRDLKVKVLNQKGTTVRSRLWVSIPVKKVG